MATTISVRTLLRSSSTRARIIACLAATVFVTACGADQAIAPANISRAPNASHGGGGGGGGVQPPAAQGPLAGTWVGLERWGPETTFTAAWTVQVVQDSVNSSGLVGTAVAALEPPDYSMGGVVQSPTHVLMNFTPMHGKFSVQSTLSADLTLSADGDTLSGSFTSIEPGIPTTMTLTRQ